jgi:ADP-ribosyl-[dinitrogen reductase] hydrolase
MRLAPVPLFFCADPELAIQMAGESSRLTHGSAECIDSCRLLAAILMQVLAGKTKEEALKIHGMSGLASESLNAIARGDYFFKSAGEIKGSGYVVESLEAALWCFKTTSSYEQAVLAAANLGDDSDTTAAVCGQVAGAFYGEAGIPQQWLARIARRAEIVELADQLLRTGVESGA